MTYSRIIVTRASGYTAGSGFPDLTAAQDCADACNANVPADPAHVVTWDDSVWDGVIAGDTSIRNATYAIHAQVRTHSADGYSGSRQVPVFYLDCRVQGITGEEHAAELARDVINPLGAIPADDLQVTAYRMP